MRKQSIRTLTHADVCGTYADVCSVQELSEDAGAKHSIATSAHAQMREGQELLEKREAFERWEDVVNIGLQASASLVRKLLVY